MSRKTARKDAFTLCFETSFYDVGDHKRILDSFFSENRVSADDCKYIYAVVNGVFENIVEIDAMISKNLKNWSFERVGKVDLAIMRVCVYEMLKMDKISPNISINEAVEIAKMYGADESPSFINGVLSGVNKEIKNR